MRPRMLLWTALGSLILAGCGQRPRLDVVPSVEDDGSVVFDIPRRDVNGLLRFRVADEAGKVLWEVDMSYEEGRRIKYGEIPTGENMKACQVVPSDGKAPPDIRGRRVTIHVKYQFDDFMAPSAADFEKTVDIP